MDEKGSAGNLVSIEQGKEYTVRIVDRGKQGDGIARVGGLILFVPGTAPGDEVRVLVTRLGRNCAFAQRIVEGEAAGDTEKKSEE
ncbi:MAG: TRAM domain-containing protein [Methanomassiliicoccales archaeon]|jgi:predicted RNA-binding protein with TRAM domain|nr:TRAM domain-containing protein [Methanomassiliicoccales archaeon]